MDVDDKEGTREFLTIKLGVDQRLGCSRNQVQRKDRWIIGSSMEELVAPLSRKACKVNSCLCMLSKHLTLISTVLAVLQILGILMKTMSVSSESLSSSCCIMIHFPLGSVRVCFCRQVTSTSSWLILVSNIETLISKSVFRVLPLMV